MGRRRRSSKHRPFSSLAVSILWLWFERYSVVQLGKRQLRGDFGELDGGIETSNHLTHKAGFRAAVNRYGAELLLNERYTASEGTVR